MENETKTEISQFIEEMSSSEVDSDCSNDPETTTEDDISGPVLTKILPESGKNTISVFWDENGKSFYGYFCPALKRGENDPFVYPIVCHRQKVHSRKLRKEQETGCKYRFR